MEARPAARRRRGLQRHQRQHSPRGQARCLAPARQLPVWLESQGTPITATNPYDPTRAAVACPGTGWNYFVGNSTTNAQVDPLPLEAVIGWDASQNGNLAQLLQEPSPDGRARRCGNYRAGEGSQLPHPPLDAPGAAGAFPTGTTLLTGPVSVAGAFTTGDANPLCHTSTSNTTNPFPSNFMCNPSSIDGLGITDSSQGGGGIFVHGWGHNLQIANNRIYSNAGTLSGGINLGQGEFAPTNIAGQHHKR